jgi:hypothetical protein
MKTVEKIDLNKEYSEKIQQLFVVKEESTTKKLLDYKKFGFTKEDIPELLKLALDYSYYQMEDEKEAENFYSATIYAMEILGKLKAVEAINPFIKKVSSDRGNEYFTEAIPSFFANIGAEAVEPLIEYITDREDVHLILFEVFEHIVKKNPKTEDRVASFLAEYITDERHTNPLYLAFAITSLVEINGIKYIDAIRESFNIKEIDFTIVGDFESIEEYLGLK